MVGLSRVIALCGLATALTAQAVALDWTSARPQSVDLRQNALDLIPIALNAEGLPQTQAILIARRGRLVFETYANGADAATLIDGRSMGKTITALAAGLAIADGKLKLSDWVLPEREDIDVRVRDLLTMSSQLDCDDDIAASPGNENRLYFAQNWAEWAAKLPAKRAWGRDGAGLGPFAYCTAGVVLLGRAIERAVGQPFDAYAQTRIFQPLGITRAQWRRSPSGEVMAGGSLRLSARDWAKIGEVLLQQGRFGKTAIAPGDWARAMLSPQRIVDGETAYGYLVWRRSLRGACGAEDSWFLMGAGGSAIFILPKRDMVIAVLRQDFDQLRMHRRTRQFVEATILPAIPC